MGDAELAVDTENTTESETSSQQPVEVIAVQNLSPGRAKLQSWFGTMFRVEITDGRILIGEFVCTDSDANIILGLCSEYTEKVEERFLGLVMVPGRHIVNMEIDISRNKQNLV